MKLIKNYLLSIIMIALLSTSTVLTINLAIENIQAGTFGLIIFQMIACVVMDAVLALATFYVVSTEHSVAKRKKENQIITNELNKRGNATIQDLEDTMDAHGIRVIEVSADDTIETLFDKIQKSSNMPNKAMNEPVLPNTIAGCKKALKQAKTQSEVDALLERLQELRNK